ncbi:hypothetical protein Slin15195_G106950 [Septoria linicola]|uniref:Leucine-rich repeat domain-containing protein n=1 Tax=Septoria linicola TaxID=215465 RepID=A0A9Q9EN33_9PEZI|nr:hypothetical protein Slin15195_G106950 [Septoria linicola]
MHIRYVAVRLHREVVRVSTSSTSGASIANAILPFGNQDPWAGRRLLFALTTGLHDGNAVLLLILAKHVETLDLVLPGDDDTLLQETPVPSLYDFASFMANLVSWANYPDTEYPHDANRQSIVENRPLTKVHTVCLRPYWELSAQSQGDVPLPIPDHYMNLPSITSMTSHGSALRKPQVVNDYIAWSSITKLHLYEACICTTELARLVQSCYKLVDLEVEWDFSLRHGNRGHEIHPMDFSELSSALKSHTKSLTHLRLLVNDAWLDPSPNGTLHSLAKFNALETLELDECCIFASGLYIDLDEDYGQDPIEKQPDVLPSSLREFMMFTRQTMSMVYTTLLFVEHMMPASLRSLKLSFSDALPYDVEFLEPKLGDFLNIIPQASMTHGAKLRSVNGQEAVLTLHSDEGVCAVLSEIHRLPLLQDTVEKLKAANLI